MRAIVLLSGGIDSAVNLAIAKNKGKECLALSFDYGQRHIVELQAAKALAQAYQTTHHIIRVDNSAFLDSALLKDGAVPQNRTKEAIAASGIPDTYVPARNTLFLAYALSQAEAFGAEEIYFGANADDLNPYPDCRPAFIEAFQQVCRTGTQHAGNGAYPKIVTPLLHLDKHSIIRLGIEMGVPLHLTHSCYAPAENGRPCRACDACALRQSYDELSELAFANTESRR